MRFPWNSHVCHDMCWSSVLWYGALESTLDFFSMSSFAVMCAMSFDAILSQVCFANGHIVVVVSIEAICAFFWQVPNIPRQQNHANARGRLRLKRESGTHTFFFSVNDDIQARLKKFERGGSNTSRFGVLLNCAKGSFSAMDHVGVELFPFFQFPDLRGCHPHPSITAGFQGRWPRGVGSAEVKRKNNASESHFVATTADVSARSRQHDTSQLVFQGQSQGQNMTLVLQLKMWTDMCKEPRTGRPVITRVSEVLTSVQRDMRGVSSCV